MARENYQTLLEDLRTDTCSMAETVLGRYNDALTAYRTGDDALAEAVIEGDHEINQQYLDLEEDCIDLFALQQPVAGDLRFIASTFKIVTDLERIGDLATNLARYGTAGETPPLDPSTVDDLGEKARSQVRDAMDAYEANDAEATWEIAARDDDLDDACEAASEAVVRDLLGADSSPSQAATADPALLAEASRSLLTIRDLERVGDHAVNICARTLYMVEADEGLIY